MLIHAFAGDILDRVRIEPLQAALERELLRATGEEISREVDQQMTPLAAAVTRRSTSRAIRADFPILRQPGPRQAAGLSRQRRDHAEAAGGARRAAALLHRRSTPTSTAACTAQRARDRRLRGGAREDPRASSTPPASQRDHLHAQRDREHQPGGADASAGRMLAAGRRGAHLGDGAPLEHRAVADAVRGDAARRCASCRSTTAASCILDEFERLLDAAHADRVDRARVERARHDQPGRARSSRMAHARGVPVLIDGAQAALSHAGRRAGARLRLLRLHRPQALRPDRHRRALRQGRAARGDAAVSGRRRHDPHRSPSRRRPGTTCRTSSRRARRTSPARSASARRSTTSSAVGLRRDRGARGRAARVRHRALLEAIPGVRLIGTAPGKASVLSFVMDGVHPHDIGTILDREGVAIRTGHHCAQPVMERFGIPATARASLAMYNTREEI